MIVKVVLPRAGGRVLGGAEGLGFELARLLHDKGHDVEVVTTSASSHITWENDLADGEDVHEGIRLRRFRVAERDGRFIPLEWRAREGDRITLHEERFWYAQKGYAPGLIEYLRDATYDVALLGPYTQASTIFGAEAAGDRAVVFPCLHDEGYARLRTVGRLLHSARGVLFNCEPEGEVVERLWGPLPRTAVGGYPFDPVERGDGAAFREARGLPAGPLLLYSGRWELGKGLPTLLRYVRGARRRGFDVTLALTGSGPEGPHPGEEGMVPLGFISPDEKLAAMAAADIYVHPSPNESLSIVLMEAWLQGTPGMVWGLSHVSRSQCAAAGGGLWFSSYPEFEIGLERLLGDALLRDRMAANGARYTLSEFGTEAVADRVERALEEWAP